MRIHRRLRSAVLIGLYLLLALNACEQAREPDPRLAGKYVCVKSSEFWRNPASSTLFEEWYVLELRADGNMEVTWSYGNYMRARGYTEIWLVTPETKTSQGKWWSTKDKIYIEAKAFDFKLKGAYRRATAFDMDPMDARELVFLPETEYVNVRERYTRIVLEDGSEWVLSRSEGN